MLRRRVTHLRFLSAFGSLEVVNGKRTISKTQAETFVDYFHVDASLFT
ncbi:hypothetical protein [Nostoc sp. C117]